MSGMSGIVTSEVNFPPVQTISDIYSSGTWTMNPYGINFGVEIFKNATLFFISAYVTILNQGDVTSNAVQLQNGPIALGSIASGSCMGFLLTIAPGHTLVLTQSLTEVGQTTSDGTFVIAHVSILPTTISNRTLSDK